MLVVSAISDEAIGGIIAVAVVAAVAWLWTRRRKPLDWAAKGRRAIAARNRRIERARWVLQRAQVLQLTGTDEIPVRLTGTNPVVVTYHPSMRQFALYPDKPSYESAARRRDVDPLNAHWGTSKPVVSDWSEGELRTWLRKHADDLPPRGGA